MPSNFSHPTGNLVELRPLQPEDWEALFAVASDPAHLGAASKQRSVQEEVFRQFFSGCDGFKRSIRDH